MKLNATVVWSASLSVEVPDKATAEEKREAILKAAEQFDDFSDPIIHDCDDEELID